MAYIGDSTTEDERGWGMGVLGAAVGLGTILGPGLGGLIASESQSLPFFIAGGMSFLALLLVAVFLPESLPPQARQKSGRSKKTLPFGELWNALSSPVGELLVMAFLMTCGLAISSTSILNILTSAGQRSCLWGL